MARVKKTKILDDEFNIVEGSPAEVEQSGDRKTRTGIVVEAAYVNVRKEPDVKSDVLEVFRKGDRAVILGEVGGFYKIKTSVNPTAYISSMFFHEEE